MGVWQCISQIIPYNPHLCTPISVRSELSLNFTVALAITTGIFPCKFLRIFCQFGLQSAVVANNCG